MPALFGVPFRSMRFEDLETFLAGAESEPLLWEAKSGDLNPYEIRRQCGGFANSREGGYLILGASEAPGKVWALEGMEFPDGEPHRYVTTCLLEGVRPMPVFDVHCVPGADGGHVAIVEVQPLVAGPCIVRGTVYERVPGATIAVKDPGRLAELFRRGDQAHSDARQFADLALDQAGMGLPNERARQHPEDADDRDPVVHVLLGASTVTRAADVSAVLFRASTRDKMLELVESLGHMPYPIGPDTGSFVAQDRRAAWIRTVHDYTGDWCLTCLWTGAVALGYRVRTNSLQPGSLVDQVIAPAIHAAEVALDHIGSHGAGYVRLAITAPLPAWPRQLKVGQGPVALDTIDLAAIKRELNRSLGLEDPEPEHETTLLHGEGRGAGG
jgi:hypothetical protein